MAKIAAGLGLGDPPSGPPAPHSGGMVGLVREALDRRLPGSEVSARLRALNAAVAATRGRIPDAAGLVARDEALVRSSPSAIRVDYQGHATIHLSASRTVAGGRFRLMSCEELAGKVRGTGRPNRLIVLDGAAAATDIGAMQAFTGRQRVTYQVASQFNALEAPSPSSLAAVADYFSDRTQGPRAALGAYSGPLVRHYHGPTWSEFGGPRVVGRSQALEQVAMLADVTSPGDVRNGYLCGAFVSSPDTLVATLSERWRRVKVGVHDGLPVLLGTDLTGSVPEGCNLIAQVLTSTYAMGEYGGGTRLRPEQEREVCRALLAAAYSGTLLAAAELRSEACVLTLIGGGVFANPLPLVWGAILTAFDATPPCGLDVIVNGRGLSAGAGGVPVATLRADATARRGAFFGLRGDDADVTLPRA